jgi:hypothetical protein
VTFGRFAGAADYFANPSVKATPTAARASPAYAKFIIVLRGAYTLRCRARLTLNVRRPKFLAFAADHNHLRSVRQRTLETTRISPVKLKVTSV